NVLVPCAGDQQSDKQLRPEDWDLSEMCEFAPAAQQPKQGPADPLLKGVYWHINGDPVETLCQLATSDVLLASRSSYSYVAAMLHRGGPVLFH
ncbi:hypothetical protein NL533_30315, partial [Klebsiella pneumoniae]|nr:hypothetical protein [Klebsiella pneumoniae]